MQNNVGFDISSVIRTQLIEAELKQSASWAPPVIPKFDKPDEFRKKYTDRKLGIVASVYGGLKNLTGIGKNSKKANATIKAFSEGKISEEKTKKYLKDYKYSQKDATEFTIDTITALGALAVAKNAKKASIILKTFLPVEEFFKEHSLRTPSSGKVAVALAIGTGMVLKPFLKGINKIGMNKEDKKPERSFFRDVATGAIDGALAPLGLIHGAAIGALAFFGGNSVSRYVFMKKDEKTDRKSIVDFAQKQTQNLGVKAAGAGALVYATVKGKTNLSDWQQAANKAIQNAKNVEKFEAPEMASEFQELVDKLGIMDEKVFKVVNDTTLSIEEKMRHLEKENIFIPKFLQTIPDNISECRGQDELGQIVTRFKSDCPTSRTLEQAQDAIKGTFGNKYDVEKLVGTGTVAETYLAKETGSGKEVVIKMLKDGMSLEKIEKDKGQILKAIIDAAEEDAKKLDYLEKCTNALFDAWLKDAGSGKDVVIKMPTGKMSAEEMEKYGERILKAIADSNGVDASQLKHLENPADTLFELCSKEAAPNGEVVVKMPKTKMSTVAIKEHKDILLKAIEDLAKEDANKLDYFKKRVNVLFDAWSKEVDLGLEGEAAELLGKNAKSYMAAKPIETVNNIYVMEKAPGIQFNQFTNHLKETGRKLTMRETSLLSMNYIRAFFEQMLSVPKKGMKVMHADPHPGNVFIDIDNPNKMFTFIDTGNVLRYTPKEAITNTINHIDYVIGNSNGIAKAMLNDAVLPDGMSQKQAVELLTKELSENVYNTKTTVSPLTMFRDVNNFCVDVMQKNKIIPNPNNTNLLKAEETYFSNFASLDDIYKYIDRSVCSNDLEQLEKEAKKQAGAMLKEMGQAVWNSFVNNAIHTTKEIKSRVKHVSDHKEEFLTNILGYGKV